MSLEVFLICGCDFFNTIYMLSSIDDYGPFFSLDVILSHMDDENYGIKNTNTLDRIAHGIHMHHMWEQAALLYKVGCN